MATYYHVCADGWDGDDLISLLDQYDDWRDAEKEWYRRWPEGGDIGPEHMALIHLHETLEQAREYQCAIGGDIVRIDCNDPWAEGWISIDDAEYPHPVCRTWIPHQCLSGVSA